VRILPLLNVVDEAPVIVRDESPTSLSSTLSGKEVHIMLKHSAYKFVLHPKKEQKFLIIKTTVIRALSSTISYRSGKRLT